jgi:hypothetical protein
MPQIKHVNLQVKAQTPRNPERRATDPSATSITELCDALAAQRRDMIRAKVCLHYNIGVGQPFVL